jgi:hypothetical protein
MIHYNNYTYKFSMMNYQLRVMLNMEDKPIELDIPLAQ